MSEIQSRITAKVGSYFPIALKHYDEAHANHDHNHDHVLHDHGTKPKVSPTSKSGKTRVNQANRVLYGAPPSMDIQTNFIGEISDTLLD